MVGDEVVLGVFHQGPQTFGLQGEAEYKCAASSSRTSRNITCQTGGAHISPYMTSYALRYVGVDTLPSKLLEFDLQQHFRLSTSDVEALGDLFRPEHRGAAAILLVFLRAAGRPLDRFVTIPRALLRYVGETLGISTPTMASLHTIYQRRPTLDTHQQ